MVPGCPSQRLSRHTLPETQGGRLPPRAPRRKHHPTQGRPLQPGRRVGALSLSPTRAPSSLGLGGVEEGVPELGSHPTHSWGNICPARSRLQRAFTQMVLFHPQENPGREGILSPLCKGRHQGRLPGLLWPGAHALPLRRSITDLGEQEQGLGQVSPKSLCVQDWAASCAAGGGGEPLRGGA